MRQPSQTRPNHALWHPLVPVLTALSLLSGAVQVEAETTKIADRAGRGCTAPAWSPDNRYVAYTTEDQDELLLVEVNKDIKTKKLYEIARGEGVGRRFVFMPGADRMALRRPAGALPGSPDRIISVSYFVYDPVMLTHNTTPILGPYRIGDEVYYRADLQAPLVNLHGTEWDSAVNLDDERLTVSHAGREVYQSASDEKAEGFDISPDGQLVAAVYETSSGKQLRLITIATGQTFDLGSGRWPGWSADSNRLVFIRDKPSVKYAELVVYDLELGQIRSIQGINQFWPNEPALNSSGTQVAFTHDGEVYVTDVTGF